MKFPENPMTQFLEKPATHAAWSPFFDEQGNFVRFVQVGEAISETDSKGRISYQMLQYSRVNGYDSGYTWLLPIGEQPEFAPPPEVLETARFEVQQRLQTGSIPASGF